MNLKAQSDNEALPLTNMTSLPTIFSPAIAPAGLNGAGSFGGANGKAAVADQPAITMTEQPQFIPLHNRQPIYATGQINIQTEYGPQFIDITDYVSRFVTATGLDFGQVLIYSRHTTAAIKINENEPLLLEDMRERLSQLFHPEEYYRHNDFDIRTHNMTPDENANGHSHCQHLMLSTSETIPVTNRQLMLGRWQRLFLIELDRARPREIVLTVNGYK